MESFNGGGTLPEKPNKLAAFVGRILRRSASPSQEVAQIKKPPNENFPDSPKELAEREGLVGQVIHKVLDDMPSAGFTVHRDMGEKARGNPYGDKEFVVNDMKIGYINSQSGKRYRVELQASGIVGALVEDSLTLEVSDRQDTGLEFPEVPVEVRRLAVRRGRSKTKDIDRQEKNLENQGISLREIRSRREAIIRDAEPIDNQESYITLLRLHSEPSGTFTLPIFEQLQFLRGILDASVDQKFTIELAEVSEKRLGKVQWNKDKPTDTNNVKKLL